MANKDEKLEALTGPEDKFVARWMEAIDAASRDEQDWRTKQAIEACKAYAGDPESNSTAFNIFHSNMETLIPALYNSTPIPDVRRRFNDDDPVAVAVAELIERSLAFAVDDYDFDDTMKRVVKDMAIVDRGVARVRYMPIYEDDAALDAEGGQDAEGQPGLGHNGGPPLPAYEEVQCEYVPWASFRHGPARVWKDVPWVAFEHYLDRGEVEKLLKGNPHALEMLGENGIPFNHAANASADEAKDTTDEVPMFGGRAHIFEIWDKDTKSVVFICPDYRFHPVKIEKDPLRLRGFFPTPRPAMALTRNDKLTPVTAYQIYQELIGELNDISTRIKVLVKALRARGAYAGVIPEMGQLANAGDNEMIPLTGTEQFATTGGGLDKAVFFWPIDTIIVVVKELVAQRELVKQTIYEVTGLSDILRGATDANETATAQQIKQQWGSIRVQNHQAEVARYARDLFRLKAEVFSNLCSMKTLLMMTGLQYPTTQEQQQAAQLKAAGEQKIAEIQAQMQAQAQQTGEPPQVPPEIQQQVQQASEQLDEILGKPSIEQIETLLRNERLQKFRVDIESDSTIRGDLTRNQEQMKGFLEGLAAYISAVGPLVQQGAMDGRVAIEIAGSFARSFNLGKQASDAIEGWIETVKKQGVGGPPPDPEKEAGAKLKMAQAQKTEIEAKLLPAQFKVEQSRENAKVRADVGERRARLKLESRGQRMQADQAKEANGLAREQMAQDKELGEKQLGEAKATRQQSEKMERMKMRDARSARKEGYEAAATGAEGAPRMPQMDPMSEDYMTDEEMQRLAQTEAALAQLTQSVQALGQQQQAQQTQQTQLLASVIQEFGQAMRDALLAPKEVIRDEKGRVVGARPMKE